MVRIQSFDELNPKLLTEYQITKSSKSGKDWNEEASFYAGRGKSLRGRGRWQQQGSNKARGTWQNEQIYNEKKQEGENYNFNNNRGRGRMLRECQIN